MPSIGVLCCSRVATSGATGVVLAAPALPAITPSCSHFLHCNSNATRLRPPEQSSRRAASRQAVAVSLRGGFRRRACLAEAAGGRGGGPVFANDVVTVAFRSVRQRGDDLVGALTAVKRLDERLHDRHRAVDRPRVAPRLEVVRRRNVPVAEPGRLVEEQAGVDAQRHRRIASPNCKSAGALSTGFDSPTTSSTCTWLARSRPPTRGAPCSGRRHDFWRRQVAAPARQAPR